MNTPLAKSDVAADSHVWLYRALGLIGLLLVFRIVYAAIVPIDLVHDEAYYWDWSRQLDWGYYSKPPMIAWLIALSTSIGGSSTFVVRLPAVLLGTGGLLFVYLLGSRLFGPKAGFWCVVLSAFTPGNVAMSLLMTIDAPLLFFWTATLYAFWRMTEPEVRNRWLWLAVAVAATGLGVLSKQTMLGFIPLAGFFLLTGHADRRELLRPWFWLWSAGSLMFLTPVVWWNYQNNWITVQHTSDHFSGASESVFRRIAVFGEFVASQFGIASPVTAFLCGAAIVAGVLSLRHLGRRERYLLCFSGLPLAGVMVLALTQRVEANWPAPFYVAAVVLAVGWVSGKTHLVTMWNMDQRHLRRAAAVGIACVFVTYLVPFGWGLQGTKIDPVVRLRGWKPLGRLVGSHFDKLTAGEEALVIVTAGRAAAAELAFYMPTQPQVYTWKDDPGISSQYDLWGGPQGGQGRPALIVTSADAEVPAELRSAFASVEPGEKVEVEIGAGRKLEYRLWRATDFRHWPEPVRIAAPVAAESLRR